MPVPRYLIHVAHSEYFFHRAVASLLAASTDMELGHVADNGTEAVSAALRLQPDVVLMGSTIENVGYLEATRRIMADLPSTKVVLISAVNDTESVSRAWAAGVSSYLTPDAMSTDFTAALRLIGSGNMIFTQPHDYDFFPCRGLIDYDLLSRFMRHTTVRERRLLIAMAHGHTNAQIAALLNLSEGTVKAELAKIMGYFKVRTRVQLAVLLVQAGFVEVERQ